MNIRPICGALVALVSLLAGSAPALPGTHAPAISTYDTRASSIVFAYRHGASAEGPFNSFSYNANFSSTTGKLSATLGGGFSGDSVVTLGAGLVIRWDDIVPAVLPVERRLDREGCDAIEGRFRSCPGSRRWLSPEQRARLPGAAPTPTPTPTPPAPTPTPPSAQPSATFPSPD